MCGRPVERGGGCITGGILTCSALMDGRGSQTRILMGRDTLMTSVPSHTDTLHCQSGALLQTFIMTEVSKTLHLFMLIFYSTSSLADLEAGGCKVDYIHLPFYSSTHFVLCM